MADDLKPKIILPDGSTQAAPDEGIDLSGTAHGQLRIARRILAMDELVRMTDLQPQFEKEMKLPGDSRGVGNIIFMFSINGMLDAKAVRGALLAGECMLVQAPTLKRAQRLCREGLLDTLKAARQEYEDRLSVVTVDEPMRAGLSIDGAGKHGEVRPSEDPALLKSDPLMKRMLASIIGKMPWRH